VDGIRAIQARVAQLQAMTGAVAPARPVRPATSPSFTAPTAPSSFDAALRQATATANSTATGALRPAVKQSPGAYGAMVVPPELQQYGNGKIPEQALQPIGVGEFRLSSNAAASFRHMHADASAAGINIGVNDAYRTYDEQVDLAARKGLYSQGGLAATPGKSNHGWGLAVDLELDSQAQAWMRENAHKYGFVEDVPREPWHWTYRPA
jgi:D-alanyl-D-alanine carboxypeptidase